ncbi:MAG TPA: hypothetical protein VFW47_10115, partial [Phenylobacterium sp.]|nr:hypothetical protein [Phenylobacterium sp.]
MRSALALALLASTAGAALAQERPESDHDRWHDAGERSRPMQRQQAPQAQVQPQQQIQPQQVQPQRPPRS